MFGEHTAKLSGQGTAAYIAASSCKGISSSVCRRGISGRSVVVVVAVVSSQWLNGSVICTSVPRPARQRPLGTANSYKRRRWLTIVVLDVGFPHVGPPAV